MESVFKKRKGFAIILVAALAGLLFLLGASLVAISQLQRAASNYDQRTRLARDNAKAALEMAVGEMQRQLGPDKAITYQADLERTSTTENFKDPSSGDAPSVYQPFWMSAKLSGGSLGTEWLVTKYPGVTTDVYDPLTEGGADWVTLVGDYSVYSSNNEVQQRLKVRVPKEAVETAIPPPGYEKNRTIGHVANWVGDLGTKASYALYDKTDFDLSTPYADADQRDRLRQLRGSNPGLETVETNDGAGGELADSNPKRIDAFVNDFQFRERFGGSGDKERYLKGLIEETPDSDLKREVSKFFHDYTPLSKGLLTDPVNGGFKRDLSRNEVTGDVDYDLDYLPYSRLASEGGGTADAYDNHTYTMRAASANSPAIMPVLTQFNLNYSVYFDNVNEARTEADLYLSLNAAFEFWNPFTSDLTSENLEIVVDGLPTLELSWDSSDQGTFIWSGKIDNTEEGLEKAHFVINKADLAGSVWRSGQISCFSGPNPLGQPEGGPFALTFGSDLSGSKTMRLSRLVKKVSADYSDIGLDTGVDIGFLETDVRPKITVTAKSDEGVILAELEYELSDELYPYDFPTNPGGFTGPFYDENPTFSGIGKPRFGFSWKVSDNVFGRKIDYNPFGTVILQEALEDYSFQTQIGVNLGGSSLFLDGDSMILGGTPVAIDPSFYWMYDTPFIELPKQELTSTAGVANRFGVSFSELNIGEHSSEYSYEVNEDQKVSNEQNVRFDDSFFSTIPQEEGVEKPSVLPNSGYVPVEGATMEELQSENAAEHLWVHGMFNVHSTSMDAWAAMLKSSPASRSNYWKDKFDGLAANERYLFFNYPQSAENVWTGFDYDPEAEEEPVPTDLDFIRQSMRQGVFALTGDQIDVLAKHIVSEIRKRYQGHESYEGESGPFASLREFVDSGVLQNAIVAANLELKTSGIGLTKDWVVTGKGYAAEFRQSTILNLLAPYLSVRSDTFLVRAYGDAVNPADPAEVWARAYCEAVVQRTHEMHSIPAFGRKLKVVAFRWLAPSEI